MTVDLVVIGLGYVGLPLADLATRTGLRVVGLDIDPAVVAAINSGRSHIDDLADAEIARDGRGGIPRERRRGHHRRGGHGRDLRADAAVRGWPGRISARSKRQPPRSRTHLRPGMLVVLESTSYPGTTDELVRPILEESGLVAGVDFHLAFSPERIDPGNAAVRRRTTRRRSSAGYTQACTERAAAFYGRFVDTVVRTKGTREAETAKLLENTYRHVNIALVNEMARFCHELGHRPVGRDPGRGHASRSDSRRSIPVPAWVAIAFPSTRTT